MPWCCNELIGSQPAVRTDLSPQDSWELSTPQLMKFYVKGGKHSNVSMAISCRTRMDPFDGNKLEDFVIALANMESPCRCESIGSASVLHGADPATALHIRRATVSRSICRARLHAVDLQQRSRA